MSAASMFFSSEMSLLAKIATGKDLQTANEIQSIIWSFTYAVGMALSGFIENNMMKRFDDIKNYLPMFGISIEGENKDIDINIKELLKTTNTKNWYSLIRGFLNIWEFMFLFSNIEMILKQILKDEEIYTFDYSDTI
jgi:hypothetical protein